MGLGAAVCVPALIGITAALLVTAAGTAAVIAVLRNQFAQSIALGTSLGDIFNKSADKCEEAFWRHTDGWHAVETARG